MHPGYWSCRIPDIRCGRISGKFLCFQQTVLYSWNNCTFTFYSSGTFLASVCKDLVAYLAGFQAVSITGYKKMPVYPAGHMVLPSSFSLNFREHLFFFMWISCQLYLVGNVPTNPPQLWHPYYSWKVLFSRTCYGIGKAATCFSNFLINFFKCSFPQLSGFWSLFLRIDR